MYWYNDLIIASDWFSSNSISYGQIDSKPEIKVINYQVIVKFLHAIEDVAVKQLKLLSEFKHSGSNKPVFKHFPSAYNLFLNCHQLRLRVF